MKTCSKCSLEKSEEDFRKDKNRKDGCYPMCKSCCKIIESKIDNRIRCKLYRQNNIDKIKDQDRKRWRANKVEYHERHAKYIQSHPEKVRKYRQASAQRNRDKNENRLHEFIGKVKKCPQCNKIFSYQNFSLALSRSDGHSRICKSCISLNRKKNNPKTKNRYYTDINFRLKKCLRANIQSVLIKGYKSDRTMNLIGCPIDYLKTYIQERFQNGMSWENYGEWHIDHIRPCASFDLTNVEEQHKCFHYTNLQPLWKEENIRKGAKYNGIDYAYYRPTSPK